MKYIFHLLYEATAITIFFCRQAEKSLGLLRIKLQKLTFCRNAIYIFYILSIQAIVGLEFPLDHTFHKDYKLEWCYFVGNLKSIDGVELGYELSFFRAKLDGKEDIFPVHFAISDPNNKKHHTNDVLHRRFGSIASYSISNIQSGDYSIQIKSPLEFEIKANPRGSNIGLQLKLTIASLQEILPQGINGVSPKSRKYPNVVSNYYSIPRLKTNGYIRLDSKEYIIKDGYTWMDHEWSSPISQKEDRIGSKQSQWDWICINLDDGTDIMAFNFRYSENDKSESFGTIRDTNGKIIYFKEEGKVSFYPGEKFWKSQKTEKKYPMEWNLKLGGYTLEISPTFEDQEFIAARSTRNSYWEGGVRVIGELDGKIVKGNGYLELK
jgi:predicted secreted hydrolase